MLKKKNIAIMTAVTTVATSVAPVFAAVENVTLTQNDVEKVVSEVEKLLNTRYSNKKDNGIDEITTSSTVVEAHENSVYEIIAEIDGETPKPVTSVNHLKTILENANVANKAVKLTIVDKGHTKVDGRIESQVEYKTNSRYTVDDIKSLVNENPDVISKVEINTNNAGNKYDKDGILAGSKATITLVNGKEIVLYANESAKLNFARPIDDNKNYVDLTNADADIKKSVVGFEEAKQVETDQMYDILDKKVAELKIVAGEVSTKEFNATDLYVDGGLTGLGKKFYAFLEKNQAKEDINKVNIDGTWYQVSYNVANHVTDIAKTNDGYAFSINVEVADPTKVEETKRDITLTIKGNDQSELTRMRKAIENNDLSELDKEVNLIAGDDRFETAVAISEETYNENTTTANSVIIVGEEAIVDGLAVAPLAAQENAPILLTGKDKLNSATRKEISRLIADARLAGQKLETIYVVGGEARISADVVNELKSFGVEIKRLAGDDRQATSLAIGKEMIRKGNLSKEAFVVGADGEADAMSIAAYAAQMQAPIVVTAANGLNDSAKAFIKDFENIDIIGGDSKVSTQVLKDIRDNSKDDEVRRISGTNRHETNAKVIETYYGKDNTNNIHAGNIANVYVAKDAYGVGQEGKLIDALAVAPLAGKNNAPIVLSTTELTEAQVKAVKEVTVKPAKLHQVGRGIASIVINKLANILK